MTNHSGHYKPTNEEMIDVIKALHRASDEDLKVYISYSNSKAQTFSVLDILQQENFELLKPIASNESINLETGKLEENLYSSSSDYIVISEASNNDVLSLKEEVIENYRSIINCS